MWPRNLPQELIDAVTDTIASECREALHDLALTSRRHFLNRCRAHLFQALHIYTDIDDHILMILRHNPSLLDFVREVRVKFDFTSHEHLENQGILAEILGALGGVKVLSLTPHYGIDGSSWHEMHPISREAILGLFQRQTLTHLHISHLLDAPLELVYGLPRLCSLTIGPCTTFTAESNMVVELGRRESDSTRPKYLNWGSPGKVVPWILDYSASSFCSRLVELDLEIRTVQEQANAWSLTQAASESIFLQRFTLRYLHSSLSTQLGDGVLDCFTEAFTTSRTLPSFPSLHTLNVVLTLTGPTLPTDMAPFQRAFLPGFCAALLSENTQPSLQLLSIQLVATPNPPMSVGDFGLLMSLVNEHVGWGRLDSAVSSVALYPSLRGLRVSSSWWGNRLSEDVRPLVEQYRGMVLGALPKSVEAIGLIDLGSKETMTRFAEVEASLNSVVRASLTGN